MTQLNTDECPICHKEYDSVLYDKRCMLDFYNEDELNGDINELCRHTFCGQCIFNMYQEVDHKCPICRRPICRMIHCEGEAFLESLGEDNKVCKECCRDYVKDSLEQDKYTCGHNYCTECLKYMAYHKNYECKICDDNIKELVMKYDTEEHCSECDESYSESEELSSEELSPRGMACQLELPE